MTPKCFSPNNSDAVGIITETCTPKQNPMIADAGVRKPPLSKAKRTFAIILMACPIAIQTGLGIAFLLQRTPHIKLENLVPKDIGAKELCEGNVFISPFKITIKCNNVMVCVAVCFHVLQP